MNSARAAPAGGLGFNRDKTVAELGDRSRVGGFPASCGYRMCGLRHGGLAFDVVARTHRLLRCRSRCGLHDPFEISMTTSVFELFKVGIGPSSSHTVGPMRAAGAFVGRLQAKGHFDSCRRIRCRLYGSLGATGRGHGSDRAIMAGLEGHEVDTVAPELLFERAEALARGAPMMLGAQRAIEFIPSRDIEFLGRKSLPKHPNGITLSAFADCGSEDPIYSASYYSVGGGSVHDSKGICMDAVGVDADSPTGGPQPMPLAFVSAKQLLELCESRGESISSIMMRNECAMRPEAEVRAGAARLWSVMRACIDRGCRTEGVLPGGLAIKRRAPLLYRRLECHGRDRSAIDPLSHMDWVTLFALAVNEENAAGGRIVTAPTNGAAGIIPAVLRYYEKFVPSADADGIVRMLLTAAAVGSLYRRNASISGAEVGCQGEVGVACSMAAAALAEVLGGTPAQVENAAEIGMEHNLGLTCDPIGGLVQVPCIERNAMGAMKAINAARMALLGDGRHHVSLDRVIATMRETGRDMSKKYKETSRGGLAVNIIEC